MINDRPRVGKTAARVSLLVALLAGCAEPSIFDAAAADDTAELQRLLAAGASLEARDERGWTPLHHAAAGASIAAIDVLTQAGADPGAVAQQGFTPLHVAVVEADLGTVRRLVEAGAPLDALALDGVTARRLAERRGDREVADYLGSLSAL